MVSTRLKNICQIGSFPQVGVKSSKYLKPPPRHLLLAVEDRIFRSSQTVRPKTLSVFQLKHVSMGGRLPLNPYPWLFLDSPQDFWDKSKFTGLGGKNHRSLTGYNRSLHLIFLGWEDKPIYAPMGPFCKWLVFEWVLFSQGIWSTTQGIVSLHLVGGFNPNLNNYIVKMDHFPRVWGENKKYVKPPPSHSITRLLGWFDTPFWPNYKISPP